MENNKSHGNTHHLRPHWRRFGLRLALLTLFWLGLNGADMKSWMVGAPIVMLAAAVNFPFLPRGAWRWRLRGVLPMLVFFVKESYLGAYDVARRAFTPSLLINPGFVEYHCRLTSTSARLFFADLITLLPGTLSARVNDSHIIVHAPDTTSDIAGSLRALEERVALLFGAHILEQRGAES